MHHHALALAPGFAYVHNDIGNALSDPTLALALTLALTLALALTFAKVIRKRDKDFQIVSIACGARHTLARVRVRVRVSVRVRIS